MKPSAPLPETSACATAGGQRIWSAWTAKDVVNTAGSARRAASSTRCSPMRVCTSTRPPVRRGPTNRAAITSRPIASDSACWRSAVRCWSKSRNATEAHRALRPGDARSRASVPITTRALPFDEFDAVTSPTCSLSSALSSSRARETPSTRFLSRAPPQSAHTGGLVSPQREHVSVESSTCRTAPRQRSQHVNSPHATHASSRTRPVRFRMQATRPGALNALTSSSLKSPSRPGGSLRRSTTWIVGQPPCSADRSGS